MNRACEELLANAAFSQQQNGRVALCRLFGEGEASLERCGGAVKEGVYTFCRGGFHALYAVFHLFASANRLYERLHFEWLCEKVAHTESYGLYGAAEGGVTGYDDDFVSPLQRLYELYAVHSGHRDVGDYELEALIQLF